MKRTTRINILGGALAALFSVNASAQFAATGTTTLSVTVPPEAAISVTTGTTPMTTASTIFGAAFTGTTNFTVKFRTTKTTGAGTVSVQITADFSGANSPAPSVAVPPSAGDLLTYTCTGGAGETPCTGPVTAKTTATTSVWTMGAGKSSANAGDTGTVVWSLTDDPVYAQGTYTATATFTLSAT
jgi:hypothetical protein